MYCVCNASKIQSIHFEIGIKPFSHLFRCLDALFNIFLPHFPPNHNRPRSYVVVCGRSGTSISAVSGY